jgi:hypothetical protein
MKMNSLHEIALRQLPGLSKMKIRVFYAAINRELFTNKLGSHCKRTTNDPRITAGL